MATLSFFPKFNSFQRKSFHKHESLKFFHFLPKISQYQNYRSHMQSNQFLKSSIMANKSQSKYRKTIIIFSLHQHTHSLQVEHELMIALYIKAEPDTNSVVKTVSFSVSYQQSLAFSPSIFQSQNSNCHLYYWYFLEQHFYCQLFDFYHPLSYYSNHSKYYLIPSPHSYPLSPHFDADLFYYLTLQHYSMSHQSYY